MSPTETKDNPYRPPTGITATALQRASHIRVQVSFWLCVAAAAAYVCRNSLVACEKTIRLDLGLSEYAMGIILGPAFFWSYALAQIPTGWLGERFGSRRCLPLYSMIWSAACGAFAFAAGFPMLFTSRLIGGLAQAGLFPCTTKTVSDWHPPTERALASGAITAFMSLGGGVGTWLAGALLDYISWRWVFFIYALPGFAWAAIFWLWFREYPEEHSAVNQAELDFIEAGKKQAQLKPTAGPETQGLVWLALMTSPAAWLIFIQQFFRAAGYAFFASWFATYLQETRGVSTSHSAMLAMLPLVAIVVSSLVGGGLSDYIYLRTGSLSFSRKGLSAITQLACAAVVYSAFFITDANLAVLIISLGIFCSGFAGPCSYALTMDMGGRNVAPFFSTMNMMGNIGAGLLPMVVPWFKDWIKSNPQLLALSGGNSWNAVLVLFAAMYLLSAICWLLLRTNADVYQQSWLVRSSQSSSAEAIDK